MHRRVEVQHLVNISFPKN